MFGFLKNLLRKPARVPAEVDELPEVFETAAAPAPEPRTGRALKIEPRRMNLVQQHLVHPNGKGVELRLQQILDGLPLELQPRLRRTKVGRVTISVPLEKILAQLPHDVVRISFGELRQAAPQIFSGADDRDQVEVTLPLADILAQLNPALIARRRVQRQVHVPDHISSPFDMRGQGLIFSVGPAKPTPEPTAAVPPRQTSALPPAPTVAVPAPPRISFDSPPPAAPPVAPPVPPRVLPASRTAQESTLGTAAPVQASLSQPPTAGGDSEVLIVGLTSLAETWPEAVRREIVNLNLVDAKVALPVSALEHALKLGRIAFSWKTLRSWIKPAIRPVVSAHDSTVLELPLKVIAPLFLARQRQIDKPQQRVSIDEDIPNLFFGQPRPEPTSIAPAPPAAPATPAAPVAPVAPAPSVRSADTNFYVWDDATEMVRVDESELKRGPSPGTKFIAKYATPNEVVSRAASLDGVAGALIALPDGLMVASRLAGDLNGDTLAAFLPQIFGKVSQCTKELRMGELNNLNFTVGNVPWKIFRVNAIFFAAFGRAGEPLPTAQLAALAAELDHKPK